MDLAAKTSPFIKGSGCLWVWPAGLHIYDWSRRLLVVFYFIPPCFLIVTPGVNEISWQTQACCLQCIPCTWTSSMFLWRHRCRTAFILFVPPPTGLDVLCISYLLRKPLRTSGWGGNTDSNRPWKPFSSCRRWLLCSCSFIVKWSSGPRLNAPESLHVCESCCCLLSSRSVHHMYIMVSLLFSPSPSTAHSTISAIAHNVSLTLLTIDCFSSSVFRTHLISTTVMFMHCFPEGLYTITITASSSSSLTSISTTPRVKNSLHLLLSLLLLTSLFELLFLPSGSSLCEFLTWVFKAHSLALTVYFITWSTTTCTDCYTNMLRALVFNHCTIYVWIFSLLWTYISLAGASSSHTGQGGCALTIIVSSIFYNLCKVMV